MSERDPDPSLELDELLDPARLAAAWQRPPAQAGAARGASFDDAARDDGSAPRRDAPGALARIDAAYALTAPAPLALAPAHRQVLDEIERSVLAAPGLAGGNARRVLAEPLARLAAALQPAAAGAAFDLAGAEAVIDDLEDVLQALLATARWPASGEE